VPIWDIETGLVEAWIKNLDPISMQRVVSALDILEEEGPTLGRPLVDSIKGSRHKNMKELRPGSVGTSELRILFIFDPERRAILLVAGDKRGQWSDWYRRNIPIADSRYDAHLRHLRNE
jgi:hypothetical protein